MRRMIGLALASVVGWTTNVEAQGRYTGPLPAEIEWEITSRGTETVGPTGVTVEMRFRNVSGYTINGFWALGGIAWSRPPVAGSCDGPCQIGGAFLGPVGNIDLRDLGVGQPSPLLANLSSWNFWESDIPGQGIRVGPAADVVWMTSVDLGMLGCAVPINDPLVLLEIPTYGGRTCRSEGFDGWLSYGFNVPIPDP